jgi:hypothetical protein
LRPGIIRPDAIEPIGAPDVGDGWLREFRVEIRYHSHSGTSVVAPRLTQRTDILEGQTRYTNLPGFLPQITNTIDALDN